MAKCINYAECMNRFTKIEESTHEWKNKFTEYQFKTQESISELKEKLSPLYTLPSQLAQTQSVLIDLRTFLAGTKEKDNAQEARIKELEEFKKFINYKVWGAVAIGLISFFSFIFSK